MVQADIKAIEDTKFDLIICGASYVGLSLALAIKQAVPSTKIQIIEQGTSDRFKNDQRSFAIAAAAVRMLEQLQCWQPISSQAQAIKSMLITDSAVNDVVRPIFLNFEGEVNHGEPFAYMIETGILIKSLTKQVLDLDIDIKFQTSIDNFTNYSNKIIAHLNNGSSSEAKLLVAADGARSKLRQKAGIKTTQWEYDQMGIVCTVKHERDHMGQAIEHFLPAGPFAILPLTGNRSSLVWTESRDYAHYLKEAPDLVFKQALEQRFGHKLGTIEQIGVREIFPFSLSIAREFIKPRFALAGDAAHKMHPISGQGLNLGFRDSAALAEVVVDNLRLGMDIGAVSILQQYQSWRRFETVRMGAITDILNRLFSNNNSTMRLIRDTGLNIVDNIHGLKKYLIKEASGITNNSPKLLLGKKL